MNRIKRSMSRKGILLAIALTVLLAAGCGSRKEPTKASEAETSAPAETATEPEAENQELPNPMVGIKDILAFEVIGVHTMLPEGAEGTSFLIINQEMADAQFTLDGVVYTYRAPDTAKDFVGIFGRFKDGAIARNYDYGEASLKVLTKTYLSYTSPSPRDIIL